MQNQEISIIWPFNKLSEQEKKYPYFIYSFQVLANTDISAHQRSQLNNSQLRVIAIDDRPYWDFEAITFAQRTLLFLPAIAVYLLALFLLNLPFMTRLLLRQRDNFRVMQRVGAPPRLIPQILAVQAILMGTGGSIVGVIVGYALQQIIISPDTGAPHIVLFFLALAACLGVWCCGLAMSWARKNTCKHQHPAKVSSN
ncbi:FtsX-like permease family protein [Varibaculum vaginae]|uniref:FtsX-like permease family protein n=1 Tax=Varibaculum vaginae TaxID=2364797 RepID=UPI0011C42664|nr:FtsX-like permease family protein [Varibaculum vaginae]